MTLSHSPEDIVRYLLIANGLGTLPSADGNWPVSVAQEVDSPDNVVTVYGTEGRKHGRSSVTGEMFEHWGLQVRIRSDTYTTGRTKVDSISEDFDENVLRQAVVIGSNVYVVHSINRESGPIYLGKEPGTNRHLFTINATTTVRQTT